jgi:predicted enzyme involved in methoxymalonyl-ACP biosynthesis
LNNRGKDEFTWDTLWDSINKCINIINTNMDVMNYIIVADDDDIKTKFQKNINPKVNVINIPYDNIYPKEYIDLYILSKSDLIYMVPKFSSFSTTASLLGSTKLYSFFDENETSLYRYHANILKH